jgi:hypothetical protein
MIALQRFRLGNPPHVLLRAASALTARLVSVMLSWARRAREARPVLPISFWPSWRAFFSWQFS